MLYKSEVSIVNQGGAVEADTISKNGAGLKGKGSKNLIGGQTNEN